MKNHKLDWRGGALQAKAAAIISQNNPSQLKLNESFKKRSCL